MMALSCSMQTASCVDALTCRIAKAVWQQNKRWQQNPSPHAIFTLEYYQVCNHAIGDLLGAWLSNIVHRQHCEMLDIVADLF